MNALDHVSWQWLGWMAAASWQLALFVCLVAAIVCLSRTASPRLRHALWLLVVIKAFLPPSLATPWSIGRWAIAPLRDAARLSGLFTGPQQPEAQARSDGKPASLALRVDVCKANAGASDSGREDQSRSGHLVGSSPLPLFLVWAAGGLLFWTFIVSRYASLLHGMRAAQNIDEGPLRVSLERIAIALRLRRVPDLLVADVDASPYLFGILRPRIVLPRRLIDELSEVELRAVLAHELAHWQRRDTWIGWAQTAAQSLFWFHPFVWWANGQLRHARECACDETVLRLEDITPEIYGESIVRVLTRSRGRALVAGGLVGVFERGAKLQNRFEEIMNYKPLKNQFGWPSRLAVLAIAVLLLPMSPGSSPSQAVLAEKPADRNAADGIKTAYPRIAKTSPKQGATDVDPALNEIAVTFDRDMGRGMSWTGGAPFFPPADTGREARWMDARTCVLPVKLEAGNYYRLGINSSNHQNFRGADGVAAESTAIFFVTQGPAKTSKPACACRRSQPSSRKTAPTKSTPLRNRSASPLMCRWARECPGRVAGRGFP